MICSDGDFLNVVRIILSIYKIVQVLVPLFIIVSITRDIYPSIIKGDKDALRKNADSAIKRVIAGIIIIFIPTIIRIVLSIIGGSELEGCISNANESGIQIAYTKEAEKAVAEAKKEGTIDSYKRAKQSVNKIKDSSTRREYEAELDEVYASIKSDVPDHTYAPAVTTKPKLNVSTGTTQGSRSGLNYYLNVPPNPTEGMPLIIFLHGLGEVGNMAAVRQLAPLNFVEKIYDHEVPFLLLMPCTSRQTWRYDVAGNVKSLIDYIVSSYKADTNHIIITGFSLGGYGTWNLVATYGDFFSAAVPISGCPYDYAASKYKNVPIKAMYGDREGMGCNDNLVNSIKSAGGRAVVELIPDADHNNAQKIYYDKKLYLWMIEQ